MYHTIIGAIVNPVSRVAAVALPPSANTNPNQPTITAGTPGSTTIALTGSAFSDPDGGDTHAYSQWQVTLTADTGYASPVVDSGAVSGDLVSRSITGLTAEIGYICRVRYQDNNGGWSVYSSNDSFTTAAAPANTAPDQPTITVVDYSDDYANLSSSAFADDDISDTHAYSQWQVTTAADTGYASPSFDSGEDASNLVTILAEFLVADTSYICRIRHEDNNAAWSDWSTNGSFTTDEVGGPPDFTSAFEFTGVIGPAQNGWLLHSDENQGLWNEDNDSWGGTAAGPYKIHVTNENPYPGDTYSVVHIMDFPGNLGMWRFSTAQVREVWMEYYMWLPDGTESWANGVAWDADDAPTPNFKCPIWLYDTVYSGFGSGGISVICSGFSGGAWNGYFRRRDANMDDAGGLNGGLISNHIVAAEDVGFWLRWRHHYKMGSAQYQDAGEAHVWKGSQAAPIMSWTGFDQYSIISSYWTTGHFWGALGQAGPAAGMRVCTTRIKFWSSDPGWSYV